MITKLKMIDYLQCDISSFGFQELYDLVISKNNCINCGTCLSICPRIGINQNKPILIDYDPGCSLCFKYCPRTFFPKKLFEKEIFNENIQKDSLIGNFKKVILAKSTDDKILENSQNGGVVTTLLCHALNEGLIDGVIMAAKDENWEPKPFIARTTEEILSAAGSVYAMVPTLSIYKDVVDKFKIEKLAFVGLPCQIQAVRKLQIWPPLSNEYGKFKLIIGLFCSSNYSYDSLHNIVENLVRVSISEVKKFDVSKGKFIVYLKNGSSKAIPIKSANKYHYSSCKYCKDYTAEFADISVGSLGTPSDDWNSVIVRSDVGKNIFNELLTQGKIVESNKIDLLRIKNASKKKKLNITQISDKIISAIKFFNLSDICIKTYITLLSLGEVDLQMLSEAMELKPYLINDAVKTLKERGWISLSNNLCRPISPSEIVKKEIDYYLTNFNNHIKSIKSEALEDLKNIFIQNNLMYLKDLESINTFF